MPRPPLRTRLATFLRSLLAGGIATIVDLAVVAFAVGALHASPRAANVPALLAGALVQFVGNRWFAFRPRAGEAEGALGRQAVLFVLVEIVALVLNGVLYDAVARAIPLGALGAVVARAVTTNAVFLAWSYPAWRRVFAGAELKTRRS